MKKVINWISGLALIQQLFIIVLVNILIFVAIVFGYLNTSIEKYAQDQIYTLMKNSQDEVLFAYESGIKNSDALNKRIPSNMLHIIMVKGKQVAAFGNRYFDSDIVKAAKAEVPNVETSHQTLLKANGMNYYFYYQRGEGNTLLITIVDDGFSKVLQSSLLSGTLDIVLMVMMILFFILLIWVGSIIYPINQLKAYIDKLAKGTPANLYINRKDEIGLLANSVVAMQRELATQERVKMEMLHNISHDFKTPIATIKSYAESIKDGVYPYDTLEKSVDVIYDNAARLEKKVQGLLLLNRFSYVLDESADIEQVAMPDIINKTILAVKVIRPELNINLDLQDIKFIGNQESWRVVVENIIDNALRYAINDIDIILNQEEGLLIRNDGPALEEDKISQFFKPYEKGNDGQFGLGLSIVRRVCNVYGYEVSAYNLDGKVVFRIDQKNKPLPVKQKRTKEKKKA